MGATLVLVAATALVGTLAFALQGAIAPEAGALEPVAPDVLLVCGAETLHAREPAQVPAVDAGDANATRSSVPGAAVRRLSQRPTDDGGNAPAPARALPDSIGARTEAQHLATLRECLTRDPVAFDARVNAVFAENGPGNEQFAALVVLQESTRPDADARVAEAVSNLSRRADGRLDSVADPFVLRLAARASGSPRARATLEEIVWNRGTPADARVRIHAVRALVAGAPDDDLRRLERQLGSEPDALVQSAGRAALDERSRPAPLGEPLLETP